MHSKISEQETIYERNPWNLLLGSLRKEFFQLAFKNASVHYGTHKLTKQ